MRLVIKAAVLIVIGLGCVGQTYAAQSIFPAKSCAGCTAVQMQTSAKNSFPVGIGFVYDLAAHTLRKYEVYMDSTCGANPIPQGSGTDGRQQASQPDGTLQCSSFKAADEMTPVDPDVQAAFDSLYNVYVHNYALANNGVITHYGVPIDPHHNQPFNLQNVAWDYPNASYKDFMTEIEYNLSDPDMANNFEPYLGDYLYGYRMGSFNVGVVISYPPGVEGSLSWDRNGNVQLRVCTDDAGDPGDCAEFQLTVTNGNLSITFLDIVNKDNDIYPSANGKAPGDLTQWPFRRGQGSADHFADELRNHGLYVPSSGYCPPGFHPFLTTTRQNNKIIFQSWSCELN